MLTLKLYNLHIVFFFQITSINSFITVYIESQVYGIKELIVFLGTILDFATCFKLLNKTK